MGTISCASAHAHVRNHSSLARSRSAHPKIARGGFNTVCLVFWASPLLPRTHQDSLRASAKMQESGYVGLGAAHEKRLGGTCPPCPSPPLLPVPYKKYHLNCSIQNVITAFCQVFEVCNKKIVRCNSYNHRNLMSQSYTKPSKA